MSESIVSQVPHPSEFPELSPAASIPGAFSDTLFTEHPYVVTPPELERAVRRLQFPPSYAVVGMYRLITDPSLRRPAWDKCKHGTQRGLVVGVAWAALTFEVQKKFIELFLIHSTKITGLSHDTMFGYKIPFSLTTYATILAVSSQVTVILKFFLSRNIRIARARAWDQTVISRGKGPDFWAPYVEEWDNPPVVDDTQRGIVLKAFETAIGRFIIKKLVLFPISLYPGVGVFVSAWFRALATAQFLHKPYFEAKKMTKHQVSVFMEERKWDYRSFGFVASLLEGLPIIGLVFTISNRIGAAMWAHDMEKQQHFIADEKLKGNQHPTLALPSKSSTPSSTYTALESPAAAPLANAPPAYSQ
ncbi:hypothetical protein FIBSPDRAFT_832994 [Athelia psychrophila]|uniref:Uncharacterized protein n=1 Tax=Athelia psychrophila TaxID=1759441 RepID=A0A166E5C0_9AGAM|nr:hypothetical protein FIBSPDRAFT_832994 [Fibularhizoctonia sp. CBS 109695]